MTTHISYKTAKMLKEEFLGESAPEPMNGEYTYSLYDTPPFVYEIAVEEHWPELGEEIKKYPAYQLHDLLSKPFCEAMAKKHPHARYFDGKCEDLPWEICLCLNEANFNGGMPAVEKALVEMMEGKTLIEELNDFISNDPLKKDATEYGYELGVKDGYMTAQARVDVILSRHAEEEPLAVLADRKGFYSVEILPPTNEVEDWDISLCIELSDNEGSQREKWFEGPTYSEAESNARQYLNALPDTGKGGR